MRFKELHVGQDVMYRGRLTTVAHVKDWSDGSRTVVFGTGDVHTRKANVLLSSV